jgi:hypothetical protein
MVRLVSDLDTDSNGNFGALQVCPLSFYNFLCFVFGSLYSQQALYVYSPFLLILFYAAYTAQALFQGKKLPVHNRTYPGGQVYKTFFAI